MLRYVAQFAGTISIALLVCTAVFTAVGVYGYLQCAGDCHTNILRNFASNESMAVVARLVLALVLFTRWVEAQPCTHTVHTTPHSPTSLPHHHQLPIELPRPA